MSANQFSSPHQILRLQIEYCLNMIDTLNKTELTSPHVLEYYYRTLDEYQKNNLFAKISPPLQEKLREAMFLLTETLKPMMEVDSEPEQSIAFCIQTPSTHDIESMADLPAGAEEDQELRLKNMVRHIKTHPDTNIIDTRNVALPMYWQNLFEAISNGNKKKARLKTIPENDSLLRALLAVHSATYLQQLINDCIAARNTGIKAVTNDVVITPKLFEILIKDITTSIQAPAQCLFSFGLPTHHAYHAQGSGFCVLNKTAVLLRHAENAYSEPVRYIIVGTDINRDDGLSNILRENASLLPICHIDIFDSRVYPYHNFQTISNEFSAPAQDIGQDIHYWSQENFFYHAIDLSLTQRKNETELHPALQFVLNSIQEQIISAKELGDKIILFIPMGWDSHKDETAYCAQMINGKKMSSAEAQVSRFNDNDLNTFYGTILTLYKENKECFAQLYWGLEGGYNQLMYEQQITLLLDSISEHLIAPKATHYNRLTI